MDGVTLLQKAHAVGLTVAAAGDRLVIRGPRQAEAVARLLVDHKPEVMRALHNGAATPIDAGSRTDTAGRWREQYRERAAARVRSGHYSPPLAERLAYGECIEDWLAAHPASVFRSDCAGCGAPLSGGLDLPDGARVHFQPHQDSCLVAWPCPPTPCRRCVEGAGTVAPEGWEAG